MISRLCVLSGVAFLVTACGGSINTPEAVRGVWAADCTRPFVSFSQDSIHVYPDNATYALEQASFDGNNLTVKYSSPQGTVIETYVKSGDTLRLDHGTYNGVEATWHKAPMNKCG